MRKILFAFFCIAVGLVSIAHAKDDSKTLNIFI